MRVVVDTNVLVSALLFGGTPERVFLAGLQGDIRMVTSDPLLAELGRVLERKLRLPRREVRGVVALLREIADVVRPTQRASAVKDCEADNRVLECAVAGGAEVIVTGDTRHLPPLGSFRGIPILDPATFALRLPAAAP